MARRAVFSDFDISKIGNNPFAGSLSIDAAWKEVKEKLYGVGDVQGGVIVGARRREDTMEVLVETTRYTKVFVTPVARKLISSLPSRAKDLLLWCIYTVDSGDDFVKINVARYKGECGVCHNTYLRAIDDLVAACIFAPTVFTNVYWVNPEVFFKGNRLTKFKDNINVIDRIIRLKSE